MLDLLIRDAEESLDKVDFRQLDGKRVFISGATGLIGMHLMTMLYVLKREGYRIEAAGQFHNQPASYTMELSRLAGFGFSQDEWRIPESDFIIHSAGYGQPVAFMANAAETIWVNTTGTKRLLDHLNPNGKFLFVSSNEVYHGLQKEFAAEEDIGTTTPYHPRAGYIEGKRAGEAITYAYRKSGVNALSARLNLTYGCGARANDRRALSVFIDQAIKTGHIEMKFAGRETRTCCYARDTATMLWRTLLHGKERVYNVGERSTTSIAELAQIVAKLTGSTINIPDDGNELSGSHALPRMDVSLMERDLGKMDYITLEEGLKRTIQWHRYLYETF